MPDSELKLPASSWVSGLKEDDRDVLSSYGEFVPAHPGKPFITEGDIQDNLYFLIHGSMEVARAGEVVAMLAEGEAVGEVNLFDPGTATATVTATKFSQLWRINREELLAFIEDNPGAGTQVLFALASTLAARLRSLG